MFLYLAAALALAGKPDANGNPLALNRAFMFNETAGTAVIDSSPNADHQALGYIGGPTLTSTGPFFNQPNGGHSATFDAASYAALGACGSTHTDLTGHGVTICTWFRYTRSHTPRVLIRAGGPAGDANSLTIEADDGAGNLRITLVHPESASTLASRTVSGNQWSSGEWQFLCARIRHVPGTRTAAPTTTMSLSLNGVVRSPTASVDAIIPAFHPLDASGGYTAGTAGRGPAAAGAPDGLGVAGTLIFRGILTDTHERSLFAAASRTINGAVRPTAFFDLTDAARCFQDVHGIIPVRPGVIGPCMRVDAQDDSTLYLHQSDPADAPTWDGEKVTFRNRLGSSQASRSWFNLINPEGAIFYQDYSSLFAVAAPVGMTSLGVSNQVVCAFKKPGIPEALSLGVNGGLIVNTSGMPRLPTDPDRLVRCIPSYGLIGVISGHNGRTGSSGDGLICIDDATFAPSASFGNGVPYHPLTQATIGGSDVGSSFETEGFTTGHYGRTFTGALRWLVLFNRPVPITTGADIFAAANARWPDTCPANADVRAGFVWAGDSLTAGQYDDEKLSYTERLDPATFARTVHYVSAVRGATMDEAAATISSAPWAGGVTNAAPIHGMIFLGTNDCRRSNPPRDLETLKADFFALQDALLAAGCDDTTAATLHPISPPVGQAFSAWLQGPPARADHIAVMPPFTLHPDIIHYANPGSPQIAATFSATAAASFPELSSTLPKRPAGPLESSPRDPWSFPRSDRRAR